MTNADYYRRQAHALEKLARSIRDRQTQTQFEGMAADFRARARELDDEEENVPAYMTKGSGSSDGEMDRD